GVVHKMASAGVVGRYDPAKDTKQLGFHNGKRVNTPQGAEWLTVPVQQATLRALRDVQIVDGPWALRHRQALDANYRRAPCYASYEKEIHAVLEKPWTSLADLNEALIALVARWLLIRTKIVHASELPAPQTDDATAKNIHMVRSLGGDTYLSGQGG